MSCMSRGYNCAGTHEKHVIGGAVKGGCYPRQRIGLESGIFFLPPPPHEYTYTVMINHG